MNIIVILIIISLLLISGIIIWGLATNWKFINSSVKSNPGPGPSSNFCSSTPNIDPTKCLPKNSYLSAPSSCYSNSNPDQCKGTKNNYALELNLGNGTHMTVDYICNLKDTDKNTLIKNVIDNCVNDKIVPINVGKMLSGFFDYNSKCITGELAKLKNRVMKYLISKGYCLTTGVWGSTPHTEVLWSEKPFCRIPNKNIDISNPENWSIS